MGTDGEERGRRPRLLLLPSPSSFSLLLSSTSLLSSTPLLLLSSTAGGSGAGSSRGRAPSAVRVRRRSGAGAGTAAADVGRRRGGAAHHRPGRVDPGAGRPRRRSGGAGGPRRRGEAGARDCERESGSGSADPLGLSGAALCRVPRCGHSAKKFRGSFNPKDEKNLNILCRVLQA